MQKVQSLKVISITDFRVPYLALHVSVIILAVFISAYIIVSMNMPMLITLDLSIYFISFIIILVIVLSLTYEINFKGGEMFVKNFMFRSSLSEFKIKDVNLLIGLKNNRFLGGLVITYNNRLIFRFITLNRNIRKIREVLISKGYRDGGQYRICKVCGGINYLYDRKCSVCGSKDLSIYTLIWLDLNVSK